MKSINTQRVNYYQSIHKTLRRLLFMFSIELGAADVTCENQLHSLMVNYKKVKKYLDEHAAHEDTFFHPFISSHIPDECKQLDQDHHVLETQFSHVGELLDKILIEKDMPQRLNLAYALYLYVNQFIARYLQHLQQEEGDIMPLLWQKCDDNTLLAPLHYFIKNMTMEDFLSTKVDFLPAISPQEKEKLYGE